MGNNRSYTHQVHHNNSTTTSKTYLFFPMLCRRSLNDVVSKPTKSTDLSSSSSSSSPDPSSPKISCIGQIKRRSATSYHQHHTATTITGNKSANYTKLRKLFSSKNLISPPIETAKISRTRNRNRICNGDVTKLIDSKKMKHNAVISIEDLDPPLPVIKLISRTDNKLNVNLGKRRGIELKTLQIQPFQLSAVHSS